jgi:acetyl esterase/lipase
MNKIVLSLLTMHMLTSCSYTQEVIPLYASVPNSKPSENREASHTEGILIVSKVSVPTLTMYKPQSNGGATTAVIICPGGGYSVLAAGHEGSDVAKVLNDWGITAFVLKYRLPDDSIMIDKSIGPLQDAQRAIQLVRENAAKWNIDKAKIGIMGFSAGGHLASTASTHFSKAVIENPKGTSLRPDFSILIYPVISFTDSIGHIGSRNNLIGQNPPDARIVDYSNELQVNSQTPPAFLVHSKDDDVVKVANSVHYFEALKKNHVNGEIRLYDRGGHGYGMNNPTTKDPWMDHLKAWMQQRHYLPLH